MQNKIILLVEDNPDDIELTLLALKQNNIQNDVVVAHDGVEALDYLLGTGAHTGRDLHLMPALIFLEKIPKLTVYKWFFIPHIQTSRF